MFCPFIQGECRSDCAFRHMPRGAVSNMVNSKMTCALAILSDEVTTYLYEKTLREEDHIS